MDSGIKPGAKMAAEGGESDKPPERSTDALDPDWQSGRDDSAETKATSSRPPKDLGGTLHCTIQAAMRSYDSPARGGR